MNTEKTNVVIVGVGAAGGILAAELGKAGMKVICPERGPRLTTKDFSPQDELRYFQRQDLRPDPKRQPITWRSNANGRANPIPTSQTPAEPRSLDCYGGGRAGQGPSP
jgi:gluconate 2-dehydrogenase alpha chain